MTCTEVERLCKAAAETRTVRVYWEDLTADLVSSTVTASTTDGQLTVGADSIVAGGVADDFTTAIVFSIAAGTAGYTYTLDVEGTTDETPAQVLVTSVDVLICETAPADPSNTVGG